MAAIAIHLLDAGAADPWPAVAATTLAWLAPQRIALRDTVLLLPYAALIAPARAAFAGRGGWLPRIETPQTLAASIAPPPPAAAGALSGDRVLDRLNAAALLRRQSWGAARAQADPRAFDVVVDRFEATAQALRQGALGVAPAGREAYWARARDACPAPAGPGALEALLLRAALEWATAAAPAASDALFEHRPGAWVVVRLSGRDALAEAVAAASPAPALLIDADAAGPGPTTPARWRCDGLEDEAAAAAAEVIAAIDAGRVPVALVALDRVLVRRVRALLERHAVPLDDETGWTLSTTRAAASVMALLRAAAPIAGDDARLEWLKGWPPALARSRSLEALEAGWRRDDDPSAAAARLWADAQAHLAPFTQRRERSLADWLALLRERLVVDGSHAALRVDAAGQQLLQALRLDSSDPAWQQAAGATKLDLAGFEAWVDGVLGAAQFEPPRPVAADVVLTPLARVAGRPFAQVIVPGADAVDLGAVEPQPGLMSDASADMLGLDCAARRRERQRLALARVMHADAVTLLRRRREGDEPLPPSPEVEALALQRLQAGRPWPAEADWRAPTAPVAPAPVAHPLPRSPLDLPQRLSASTLEALRTCPYRFFARAVLGLREADELEAELEKRDYGTWLHGVLHRFHRDRVAGTDLRAALNAAADAETAAQRLDAAELLPYRASFESFAPAYLAWLGEREAQGWAWLEGEVEREAAPPALAPAVLFGRLDRLDRAGDGSWQLIDYKTGRAEGLKKKVAEPLEDTQLAVYAALEPRAATAAYLALDDAAAPLLVAHPDVQSTVHELVAQLGAEFARLREGAPLPALGEGPPCDHCEARGLCRRDHWGDA